MFYLVMFKTNCIVLHFGERYFDIYCAVPGIGSLFEARLLTCGKHTSRKVLNKLLDGEAVSDDDIKAVIKSERTNFYFYILHCLNNMGLSAQRQMFYVTLVAKFRGLSWSGLALLSSMGSCLSRGTYRAEEKKLIDKIQLKIRSSFISIS